MTDLEPSKKPRRGRDFLLGFFSTLLFGIVFIFLLAGTESAVMSYLGVFVLLIGLMAAIAKGRRHIAFGILAAAVAVPLLLIGTCFAIFSVNF